MSTRHLLLYFALCINYVVLQHQDIDDYSFNREPKPTYQSDTIVFPDTIGSKPDKRPLNLNRISERKCDEYKEQVTEKVVGIPLTSDTNPVNIEFAKCDYSSVPLIVGGTPAGVSEFPHMAVIGFPNEHNFDIEWNCGGTLISDRYILTAAHCTSTLSGIKPSVVRLGELNLKSDEDGSQPEDYSIDKIITHPNYKPPASYNDIALMRLSHTVRFNNYVRPACLWTKNHLEHPKVIATGWGKIDYAESPSDTLLKVSLNIIDNKICEASYTRQRRLPQGLSIDMICAGEIGGRKDTCQGDSGGPITVTNPGNKCLFYIVGITSFGKGCGHISAPGVYTRVSSFIPWIETIVWKQ